MEKYTLDFEIRELDGHRIRAKINNYQWSKMLTDRKGRKFREIVPKEVWESAINQEVRVYLNHSDYVSIGQNVTINALDDGVFLEIELRENELGILDAVKSNRLHSCSFGFVCTDEEIVKRGDYYERTVKSMKLKEVSLLDREAAYNETEIMEKRILKVPFNQITFKRKKLMVLSI